MAPNKRLQPVYIRVKRNKSVVFLCIELKDTILNIKNKLNTVMKTSKPIQDIKLYIDSKSNTNKHRVLEDSDTAESAGLENDILVYLVYFDHDNGKWEDIYVAEFESLDEVDENMDDYIDESAKKKEKGKGRA
ncbi:unnamed protein product [Cunninghamella blakesleeana]